jgi:hypothetical protein
MRDGRIAGELPAGATEEDILGLAVGVADGTAGMTERTERSEGHEGMPTEGTA